MLTSYCPAEPLSRKEGQETGVYLLGSARELLDACAVSMTILLVRFAVRWLLSRSVRAIAAERPIGSVIGSFHTSFMGVELLAFCIFLDAFLLSAGSLATLNDSPVVGAGLAPGKVITLAILIHFVLLLLAVGWALPAIVAPEISRKSDLVRILARGPRHQRPHLRLARLVGSTTRSRHRHALDLVGVLVLLMTLTFYFYQLGPRTSEVHRFGFQKPWFLTGAGLASDLDLTFPSPTGGTKCFKHVEPSIARDKRGFVEQTDPASPGTRGVEEGI